MSILYIILAIAVCGLILWVINTYLPMDAKFKQVLNIVAIIALIVWAIEGVLSLGDVIRSARLNKELGRDKGS